MNANDKTVYSKGAQDQMSTKPMYPVVPVASQGIAGNDSRHNKRDANSGGGPAMRNRKRVPIAQRGGHGHSGHQHTAGSASGSPRATAGNPASRGGTPKSFHPDRNNPNQGGGVQTDPRHRGMQRQFGKSGQQGVPTYPHANPQPGKGNTGGRMHKRVAGHFTNKTKGAGGGFGAPPVSLET